MGWHTDPGAHLALPAKTGASCRVIAIRDFAEWLSFLNRGRVWVVRKSKVFLSTIRNTMLASDDREVDLTAVYLLMTAPHSASS